MGEYIRKRKSTKFNRHHLLYPARAWKEAGADAQYIRGCFIISMPVGLHEKLHKLIDKKLNKNITARQLPPPRCLNRIASTIKESEESFSKMDSVEKLVWLDLHLSGCSRSRLTKRLIKYEIAFLRKYEGEF